MRYLDPEKEGIWRGGKYVGKDAPFRRVTVQHPRMRIETVDLWSTFRRVDPPLMPSDPDTPPSFNPYPGGIDPNHGESITNVYADYLFTSQSPPKELPNVKSISWSRSTDQDVAECTIEFWNTSPMPLGVKPANGDLDRPGFYTAGRGQAQFSSRWGHQPNQWTKMLMPDNILRTYEGYGTDTELGQYIGEEGYVPPERDSKLDLSGIWMIDEVKLSSSGLLVCTCRDLGRLLMDQMGYLPVIPEDFYPVSFRDWSDKITVVDQRTVITDTNNVEELPVKIIGSGNDKWPESAYSGARVYGHTHTDANDGTIRTYWLSVGNERPSFRSSYEYIDISVPKATVTQIVFRTVHDGYNAYVSLKDKNGDWIDGETIGYHQDGRGRYEEGVPYVASRGGLQGEGEHTINLGPYKEITMIRFWLGNLPEFSGLPGGAFPYRAGISEIKVLGPVHRHTEQVVTDTRQESLKPGPAGANPGYVRDYTDIIKLFCAWAGFYWPTDGYLLHSDGEEVPCAPLKPDSAALGWGVEGRVWGDFEQTGVAPIVPIEASNFDKKALMDGVSYVRDIIGFFFGIDETGAVQWRMANVWALGNWQNGNAPNPGRTSKMLTIDERQVLTGLEASINSRSIREGVFVSNTVGGKDFSAMAPGYNPNPTGLRRIAGWTDQNFASRDEALLMADLITVRQLFAYRSDTVQIPGFLGIQIDDQVRIFERVTSEGFVHYVKGIASTNDAETGQWMYTLQTHWLGDDPNGHWIVDRRQLNQVTIDYIEKLMLGEPQWVRGHTGGL